MPYNAKQLHLLIMRGLAQDSRDFHGKTAQQHFSMPVAPAWGKGFSNGAFREHLWYHRNLLPWGERPKVVLLCAGQLVDVVFLLSLFHTTTVADLALLISSPLT